MRSSVYAAVRPSVRPSVQQQQIPGGSLDDGLLTFLSPLWPYGISPFRSGRWTDPSLVLYLPLPLHHRFLLPRSLSLVSVSPPTILSPSHSEAWGPNEDVSSRPAPRARSCLRPLSVLVTLMPRPPCAVWPLGTGRSRKTLA